MINAVFNCKFQRCTEENFNQSQHNQTVIDLLTRIYSKEVFYTVFLVVFRYTKDISYYQKELTGQVQKHQLLSSAPDACPHVISKQAEVIKETEAMIPDCTERLERARADLKEYLEQNPVEDSSSEIFIEAQRMIEIS